MPTIRPTRVSPAIPAGRATGAAKATVTENIANNNAVDGDSCDGVDTGITATDNVASMSCTNGVIGVTTDSTRAGGITLNWEPTLTSSGQVVWDS